MCKNVSANSVGDDLPSASHRNDRVEARLQMIIIRQSTTQSAIARYVTTRKKMKVNPVIQIKTVIPVPDERRAMLCCNRKEKNKQKKS